MELGSTRSRCAKAENQLSKARGRRTLEERWAYPCPGDVDPCRPRAGVAPRGRFYRSASIVADMAPLERAKSRSRHEGLDLVALQRGMLFGGREHDGPPGTVDFLGELEATFGRMAEELLEHRGDVFEGMVVVVPERRIDTAACPLRLCARRGRSRSGEGICSSSATGTGAGGRGRRVSQTPGFTEPAMGFLSLEAHPRPAEENPARARPPLPRRRQRRSRRHQLQEPRLDG